MFAFVHSHFNLVHHVFFTHSFYRIAQRPRLAGLQRSSRAAGKCARFLSWVPSVGAFAYSRERNELSNRKVRQGHRRVTPPTWQPKPYKTSFSPIFFFFFKAFSLCGTFPESCGRRGGNVVWGSRLKRIPLSLHTFGEECKLHGALSVHFM